MMSNKRGFIFFLLIIILLSITKQSDALGILEYTVNEINYIPETELTSDHIFEITTTRKDVRVRLEGELSKYAEIDKNIIKKDDSERRFKITLNFKKDDVIPPGHHKVYVKLEEVIGKNDAMIGTSININTGVMINVIYPGKFVEFSAISTQNVNENETATIKANLQSYGIKDIEKTKAIFKIFDSEKKLVREIHSEEKPMPSQGTMQLLAMFDTTGLVPGEYIIKGTVTADEQILEKTATFRVGTLNVEIKEHPVIFEAKKINPFKIITASLWNEKMDGIYGVVNITLNSTYKSAITPTTQLNPWGQAILEGYFDATNIEIGEYPGTIKVYFENGYSEIKTTIMFVEKINLEEEKIKKEKTGFAFDSTTLIIFAVIVAIIVADIWWIRRKLKKNDKKT